jgi:hypothetical protein
MRRIAIEDHQPVGFDRHRPHNLVLVIPHSEIAGPIHIPRRHRVSDDRQIVEIVALFSYCGFMNRFNDTMATPLEEEPIAVAEKHIAQHGWKPGKHGSA